MLNTIKRIAVTAVFCVISLPASAATFDFTGGANGANGNYNGNYSATVDGITVNVTAGTYDGTDLFGSNDDTIVATDCSTIFICPRVVTKTNDGLGIGDNLPFLGVVGGEVSGFSDLITFTFSQVVDFRKMIFAAVDGDDDFDLFIDGALVSEENNIAAANPFGPFGMGTSFSVGADALFDDFRIASIDVAAVPLPASAFLLMAGIGGLGAMRRRKG